MSRFAAHGRPPYKQVCCTGASPEAELLPERLPTGRFGARKAPTSRFGGNGSFNGPMVGPMVGPRSRIAARKAPTSSSLSLSLSSLLLFL